jgi:hypothetical protein
MAMFDLQDRLLRLQISIYISDDFGTGGLSMSHAEMLNGFTFSEYVEFLNELGCFVERFRDRKEPHINVPK